MMILLVLEFIKCLWKSIGLLSNYHNKYVHRIDDHLSLQEIKYEAEDVHWRNIAGNLRTCHIKANIYGSPTGRNLMYARAPTWFFFLVQYVCKIEILCAVFYT